MYIMNIIKSIEISGFWGDRNVNINFDEKVKQCAVCKKKLDEANAAFKQLIDSKGEEVTAIKRRLAEIKKDVPEDVMEMYIKRRNGKKMPAFVPLNPEFKACRCGVKLLDNALKNLQNPGYCKMPRQSVGKYLCTVHR